MRALTVRAERTVERVEEKMSLRVVRSEEKGFAIVGEFKAGPVWFCTLYLRGGKVGAHVESREGGFVVVSEVVEEDRMGGGRGYGYDRCGRVVGRQIRC